MTVSTPTTSGQILTSAYLNNNINSGLTYISTTTIGSGVSTASVAGAFSSTYDNYRIIINNLTASTANQSLNFRLGSSTTRSDYIWGSTVITLSTGALTPESANGTAAGLRIGYTNTVPVNYSFDLLSPFLANRAEYSSGWANGAYVGHASGIDNTATSYTDITILPSAGTMTGGTITIYGYRKA
jgi:hypothetical protein